MTNMPASIGASRLTQIAACALALSLALGSSEAGPRKGRRVVGECTGPGTPDDAAWAEWSELVRAAEDGVARIWDAETGARLGELVAGGSALLCAAFSPDGRRLAIGSFDGRVWLWDAESFEPVARLVGHADYVFSLAWTADSETLITGSGDHSVRLWETRSLRDRLQARRERQEAVAQVEPVVHRLFLEEGDAGRVLEAVRADTRWTGRARQVALQLVLADSLRARSSARVTAPTGAAGPWWAPQRR